MRVEKRHLELPLVTGRGQQAGISTGIEFCVVCQAGMAKFADVVYKSVTAGLGLATLWVGGNLVFNITRGISWHYAQEKVCCLTLERMEGFNVRF